MNPYETQRPRAKSSAIVVIAIVIAGLAAGAIYLWPHFESEPPQITLKPDSDVLGTGPVEIVIADQGTGLSIEVKLAEATIASEQFAQPVGDKTVACVPSASLWESTTENLNLPLSSGSRALTRSSPAWPDSVNALRIRDTSPPAPPPPAPAPTPSADPRC